MSYEINLSGKTAAIIGASRGVGREIAIKLAEAGAKVWVGSRGDGSKETEKIIKDKGLEAGFSSVDVVDEDNVSEFLDNAKEFGGVLDIVVVNAGIIGDRDFYSITADEFRRVLDVNTVGPFIGGKQALLKMKDQGHGKIIITASIAGQGGMSDFPHYGASKAGAISVTQSIADEGAKFGLNVNAVAPGIVKTDMMEEIISTVTDSKEESDREAVFQDYIDNMVPLARPQTPEDIANAVLFLSSDLSNEITGQTINIDGGAIFK